MKVQVNVQTLAKETVQLSLTVSPADSVQGIKERIALAEPNPFTEQALLFKGKHLSDDSTLSACGLEDGAVLDFRTKATEEALAAQLEDLIGSKGALPAEELGLMYTLKHGVSLTTVLQALGKNDALVTFLEKFSKKFLVKGDRVQVLTQPPKAAAVVAQPLRKIPEDAPVQVLTVTISVCLMLPTQVMEAESVALRVNTSDTVRAVKDSVAAYALVPFPERSLRLDGRALPDDQRLSECGVTNEAQLEFTVSCSEEAIVAQLVDILRSKGPMSKTDLDNFYCSRHGAAAGDALRMLGWGEKLLPFVQRSPCFIVKGSCIALADGAAAPVASAATAAENKRLLDLHEALRADDFQAKVVDALEALGEALAAATFLNIRRVLLGGAAARGVSIPGAVGAELVLVLGNVPATRQDGWLESMAACLAASLSEQLDGLPGVVGASAAEGAVTLSTEGLLGDVRVVFAPDYASYSEALAALRCELLETQAYGGAAFATQRARFVERQPEGVKATIRLLKWWRQQRQWSEESARPSDDVLELVTVHATTSSPPRDLACAVSTALAALADFSETNIAWPLASRCYRETDVWKPLLSQRPLILDPANPLVNVATAQAFDAAEMSAFARSGSLFV